MTDTSQALVPSRGNAVAGARPLAIVPRDFDETVRMAMTVHNSGMAPPGLDTPQKVTIAIMYGQELGFPPMQAIQSIAVINNRPALYGDAALALVKNSGLASYVREWVDGEGDARVAYCETQRKGEEPIHATFSVADAKRARLWDERATYKKTWWNKKENRRDTASHETPNDSPWYRFPERMMKFRARGFCLRDAYPDLLKGLHIKEELDDGDPSDMLPPQEPRQSLAPPPPLDDEAPKPEKSASEAPIESAGRSAAPPPPDDQGEGEAVDPVDAYCLAVMEAKDTDELDRLYETYLLGITLSEEQHERTAKADDMRRQMLEP